MENISHAENAAGLLGWKLWFVIIIGGYFFNFSLQALKFSASSSVEISL